MEFGSQIVEKLVESLTRFPGIGKRTAARMVLHMIKQDKKEVEQLSELLKQLTTDLKRCKICMNISDNEICPICESSSRDHSTICVVEDIRDVMAIEHTGLYNGLYHVLGGIISPLDGIKPEDLYIEELLKRIQETPVKEIIFAFRATLEGDTTMYYITKKIENKNIKISAISRGIPIGHELEFTDEITLGKSLINRVPFKI